MHPPIKFFLLLDFKLQEKLILKDFASLILVSGEGWHFGVPYPTMFNDDAHGQWHEVNLMDNCMQNKVLNPYCTPHIKINSE